MNKKFIDYLLYKKNYFEDNFLYLFNSSDILIFYLLFYKKIN